MKNNSSQKPSLLKAIKTFNCGFKRIPLNPKYLALTDGRIYSIKSRKFLKESKHRNGYRFTSPMFVEGKDKKQIQLVHRVVAKTWIKNPDNLPEINHKDGDKTNNCIDNLEWVSHRDNMRDAFKTGLMQNVRGNFKLGSEHQNAKLTEQSVEMIKYIRHTFKLSHRGLARIFNVHSSTITSIFTGRTWSHMGPIPIEFQLNVTYNDKPILDLQMDDF